MQQQVFVLVSTYRESSCLFHYPWCPAFLTSQYSKYEHSFHRSLSLRYYNSQKWFTGYIVLGKINGYDSCKSHNNGRRYRVGTGLRNIPFKCEIFCIKRGRLHMLWKYIFFKCNSIVHSNTIRLCDYHLKIYYLYRKSVWLNLLQIASMALCDRPKVGLLAQKFACH